MSAPIDERPSLIEISQTPTGLRIVINPFSSTHAVRLVHVLTDDQPKTEESPKHQGLLAGIKWRQPYLNGEKHELSLEGVNSDGQTIVFIIREMAAGFGGSGCIDAVAVLVHLGIGEADYLTRVITAKPRHLPSHEAWKVQLPPEVLAPHLP